jgi:hypothetical protein
VADPCTVLIAGSDLLAVLRERPAMGNREVLTFTDAEALLALEAMHKRRPSVVALERLFAATPRGAALINRIKADPRLTNAEIRVVSRDADYLRISPRPIVPAQLDQRGTRRAPRVRIAAGVDIVVEGKRAALVDLSTVGVQVVSPGALKPKQSVTIAVKDGQGAVECTGLVVWASFEVAERGARYRAGIDLAGADPSSIDAYAQRHKAS